ncbi:MAG: response regulator, partial [Sphaerochaetaceae bacterium]
MYSLIIVDDDELIRKGLEKVIPWNKLGFAVMGTFSSAIDALESLRNRDVDVILTDVKMPKMSGLELIEEAKRLNPTCKAVIISGFGEFELVKSALTLKAEDYLLKP